jgi:SOS regulatory protein LexA
MVKPYRQLKIEEYKFKDKIVDLYSKEESVRQWMISELIGSYGYDMSMIDIEHCVTDFSRKGFADIAVYIYSGNEKVPFIFVETKRQSIDIRTARQQLFDYLISDKAVSYGILTNGRDIEIFDKSLDPINDIPEFHRTMMPSSNRIYKYVNLRNNNNYCYCFDNSSKDLEIRKADSDMVCDYKVLHKINVFGGIVAGVPEEPLLNIDGNFELPEEWVVEKEKTFILKVTGDSMKNAGIDIGDYVVVNKQERAENMQIVVATLDGESTLKKFMYMGESILLVPENPDYEPINVQSEDFEINGIVIGIIKSS